MNLVKQSLYLCIGVLLALIGLQGIQSLWQSHKLAEATEEIVRSNAISANAQKLWVSFLDTETIFRQAIAFTDPDQSDSNARAFGQQAEQLRQAARLLQAGDAGATSGVADATTAKVEVWLTLAARHVSNEPATELPSYHLLDAAHDELKTQLVSRVRNSLPYLRCVLTWVAGFANKRGDDERKTEGATGLE